ncbi:MAG: hypothetical protein ACJ789_14180 [Thermomicrobiales bacterium]
MCTQTFSSRSVRSVLVLMLFVVLSGAWQPSTNAQTSFGPRLAAHKCLRRDDTQCAVDVWEAQLARAPENLQVRHELFAVLILHAHRSLDKGFLRKAQAAYARAKELEPTASELDYLHDALEIYQTVVYVNPMDEQRFQTIHDLILESSYVELTGVLGGQTQAFLLTAKDPSTFYRYPLRIPVHDLAYRFLVLPMSSDGTVHILFGYQDTDDFFDAMLTWNDGSSVDW